MRHARIVSAVLGLVCVVLAPGPASAADKRETLIDQIVAKVDPRVMEVLVTSRGDEGRPDIKTIKVPDVAAARQQVDKALGAPGVLAVEMNHLVQLAANDPYYSQQWALDSRHLKLEKVQAATAGDTRRPIVAVIDSGVHSGHPDLAGHMLTGYNVFKNSSTQSDACGHGTHVAGIIAATLNNGIGVAGLDQRAYVRPVKVLQHFSDGSCSGSAGSVAEGIIWAADRANVLNLSIQDTLSSSTMSQAVQYAQSKGRAVVAAAGNTGCPLLGRPTIYPAAYAGVLGVAAAGNTGTAPYWSVASYSSCGNWVDVTAPGTGIVSTTPPSADGCPTTGYCTMSGTSMAAPYAAATVALGMQHCGWSAATAASRVQTQASEYPSKSTSSGYGMIKPPKVLTCA